MGCGSSKSATVDPRLDIILKEKKEKRDSTPINLLVECDGQLDECVSTKSIPTSDYVIVSVKPEKVKTLKKNPSVRYISVDLLEI